MISRGLDSASSRKRILTVAHPPRMFGSRNTLLQSCLDNIRRGGCSRFPQKFEQSIVSGGDTIKVQQSAAKHGLERLHHEGRSYRRDGINTDMNKTKADHIRKSPTAVPRDAGRTGVRPDTIPIIVDDRGEKERGNNSRSRVVMDCI